MANPPVDKVAAARPAAIAAGLMMSLPFLLPLHRLPIPSFESEWLAAVLGLACVLGVWFAWRHAPLAIPQVALAPLALLLVVLVQVGVGLPANGSGALAFCAYLLFACALAISGHNLAQAFGMAGLCRLLAWALLAGGLANSVVGLLQSAGLASLAPALVYPPSTTPGANGVYGNLGQQNHFATQVALALGACAYLLRHGALSRRTCCGVALPLIAALLLSGSRSSALYFGCIALAWLGTGTPRRIPWVRLVALAMAVLATMALLSLGARHGLLDSRFVRLMEFRAGAAPRAFLWQQAWRMFTSHPWLGVGIDRFAAAMVDQLRPGDTMFGVDQYAHNLGLQLLAVSGLAGFLALAVPLAAWLQRAFHRHRTADTMLAWTALAILFVHSMLEQPLYYTYFLGIAAFMAGTLDSVSYRWQAAKTRGAAGMAACAALLALVAGGSDYGLLSERFYGEDAGDPNDARHLALIAELHRDPWLRPLTELISPASFVPVDAPVADKLALNTRLFAYAPVAEVAFRQAALLAQAGRPEDAQRQFRQAALAYPDEAALYIQRIDVLARNDQAMFGALSAFAHGLAR